MIISLIFGPGQTRTTLDLLSQLPPCARARLPSVCGSGSPSHTSLRSYPGLGNTGAGGPADTVGTRVWGGYVPDGVFVPFNFQIDR